MDQSLELKLSLLTCLLLSGMYVAYDWLTEPSGGHPFGRWLGIIGTLLMVFTETAYSARKRISWLKRAGPMKWWLGTHIFAGIVGPFLVLTHTGLKFQGLAGLAMGLTVLVVASGFFGRYLYNAIPRKLSGAEATIAESEAEIKTLRATLSELASRRSAAVQKLVEVESRHGSNFQDGWTTVLMRAVDEWQYRRAMRRQIKQLERAEKRKLSDVEQFLAQRRQLERQMRTYDSARLLLGLWHIIHVPMGLALFGSVGIHILATLYYGAPPLP